MPPLFLCFVVALFAWLGFSLFSGSGEAPLAPGFLLLMATLSVVVWDRFIAPRKAAAAPPKRTPAAHLPQRPVAARPAPLLPTPGPAAPARFAPPAAKGVWRPLTA